jgi:hypothetical protein
MITYGPAIQWHTRSISSWDVLRANIVDLIIRQTGAGLLVGGGKYFVGFILFSLIVSGGEGRPASWWQRSAVLRGGDRERCTSDQ